MTTTIIKVVGRGILITGFFVLVGTALYARGVEPGITFSTYGIDLKIDSEATYNGIHVPSGSWNLKNLVPSVDKFWNFADIKPGDQGENTISLHVKKGKAWLCLDFKNLHSEENGVNEPESQDDLDGANGGELASIMEFFAWHDDGDNIFEKGEKPIFGTSTQSAIDVLNNKTYPIGDAKNGRSCNVNESRYVGIYWCAGDLVIDVDHAEITCDGTEVSNASQTDSMSVDVSIRAVPANENKHFVCNFDEDPWVPPTPPPPTEDEHTWIPPIQRVLDRDRNYLDRDTTTYRR